MLTIRAAQRAAFRPQMLDIFIERMSGHLREVFPEAGATDVQSLKAFIRQEVENASRYGIDIERDVALYIDLIYGLEMEEKVDQKTRDWIERTLNDKTASGAAKIALIYRQLAEMAE